MDANSSAPNQVQTVGYVIVFERALCIFVHSRGVFSRKRFTRRTPSVPGSLPAGQSVKFATAGSGRVVASTRDFTGVTMMSMRPSARSSVHTT